MADTPSEMLPLETPAPDFQLLNTENNEMLGLSDIKGHKGTVIMFICNHCPFVKHVNEELVKIANEYRQKGIGFTAISSNDVENYPNDHPDLMKKRAKELNYPFPYLYDETQEIAKKYHAACTPDFFVFDDKLKLVYRGQLDSSRPGNDIPVSGRDLREALDDIINGEKPSENQKPSMGCGIKWKQK